MSFPFIHGSKTVLQYIHILSLLTIGLNNAGIQKLRKQDGIDVYLANCIISVTFILNMRLDYALTS